MRFDGIAVPALVAGIHVLSPGKPDLLWLNLSRSGLIPFRQQTLASDLDRGLCHFGESLQQQRQHHFEPDVILGNLHIA